MSALTDVTVDGDDPEVSSPEDLIPLREHTWQRYRQRNDLAALASLEAEDQGLAAAAFAAGYMACWGDYREIILASQEGQPNVGPDR